MTDAAAARRLALCLPGVTDRSNDASVALYVGGKLLAWSWPQRVKARQPRVARLDVLVLRCPLEAKEIMLEAEPDRFFTDPHYDGYPAILLRLEAVDEAELHAILTSAWLSTAPPKLLAQVPTTPG